MTGNLYYRNRYLKNTHRKGTIIILLLVLSCIPAVYADSHLVNATDTINATESQAHHDTMTGNRHISSTMSWFDKTTVSGKIKNFLKDFKYQSGFSFSG